MCNLLILPFLVVCFGSSVFAADDGVTAKLMESVTKQEVLKPEKGGYRDFTITCKHMSNVALLYGVVKDDKNRHIENHCTGSDGASYTVRIKSLGISLMHACQDKLVIQISSVIPVTPKGSWYGMSLGAAVVGEGEGHILFGKKGSAAMVGAYGCGIGFLLGMSKLKITPYQPIK